MTTPTMAWRPATRVAFRFGFAFGALMLWPFPLGFAPKTEWLAAYANKPLEWLVDRVATAILGLDSPSTARTNAGDTTEAFVALLVIAVLAALAATAWSLADRRRVAYPRLASWSRVVLRYWLGVVLLGYGFAKLVPTQMQPPDAIRLDERVGEMSPMGMLWTFMGSSTPYEMFAGAGEAIAGALLLARRTATLGALVGAAVLTNVVVLNFCYDVPVKLFSAELLVAAVIVALPALRRVIPAVLDRDVPPPAPPRSRMSIARERLRLAAKVVVLAAIALLLYLQVDESRDYWKSMYGELEGTWRVESFTGEPRWRVLLVGNYKIQIRYDDDHREFVAGKLDELAHTLEVATPHGPRYWRYQLRDASHLVIDAGAVHAELVRAPDPPLVTRGFHWIQEVPFNR